MNAEGIIIISIGSYLALLIFLGLYANRTGPSTSLKDFYLAGSGLGSIVLMLTLYATQYSANTMLIVPAEVVHQGLGMILILGYMTALVIVYLTFAPQLYKVSRKHAFITPGDWLTFRFGMPGLTLAINLVYMVVLINFLLAQLIAMGQITNSVTEGHIPYWVGVVLLGLIMIIYESLGGMRAVAWTDVLQGAMLLIGLSGIFFIVFPGINELSNITHWLVEHQPQKVQIPGLDFCSYWFSTVLMIGIGASVYPQAIQRIYAARSTSALKRSLSFMVFMPLITVMVLFILGIISIPHLANLTEIPRDSVLPEMLKLWGQRSALTFGLTVLVIVGLLAAIMSTADSVLLSLSSIMAKDILGASILKDAPDKLLTKWGKGISWAIMAVMILWSLNPQITLWGLIELKMQLLVQTAPAFILGFYLSGLKPQAVFIGLLVGLAFSLTAFIAGHSTVYGIQSGFIGLLLNTSVCLVWSRFNLQAVLIKITIVKNLK